MASAIARQTGQDYREALAERGWLMPLPRYLLDEGGMNDDELANEIKEMYELRRAQMGPRIILDMRALRYFDPEKLQDQWMNYWTGTPLKKLSKARGRAVEIFNWSGAIGESVVGLMTGHKPFAYEIDIPPEDPASEADAVQSDAIEGWILREQVRQKYPLVYMDGVAWQMIVGRNWKMVTTDPATRRLKTQIMWPGHVAAFWQEDNRTLEQVIVARNLTLGEAIGMYAPNADTDPAQFQLREKMLKASTTFEPMAGLPGSQYTSLRSLYRKTQVTLLTMSYRTGPGAEGDEIGLATTLLGTTDAKGALNSVMVDHVDDTGFEDIPLYCTPRFKIPDKPPDEATGVINRIAGIQTEFNEVFSAARDMLNRTIYPRLKASGFSFRNAPRFIKESAMYALPRQGQDIARIEETLNTVPVEQVLTRLEDMVIVLGGLNKFFLGSAPPSETSGDSIDAALDASISRAEPSRTEIQEGELWMYKQWLAQAEKWIEFDYEGAHYKMSDLIEHKRDARLFWMDMIEVGKVRRQQMALAAKNASVINDDTAMDYFGVRSKVDERRKMRQLYSDPVLHPERVSQTAAALIQQIHAEREKKIAAALEAGQPLPNPPMIRVSLAGQLSPDEVAALSEIAGVPKGTPGPQPTPPGGTGAIPGRQPVAIPATAPSAAGNAQAAAAEALRTAAARAAPPNTTANNQPGGVNPPTQAGDVANPAGPTGPVGPGGQ